MLAPQGMRLPSDVTLALSANVAVITARAEQIDPLEKRLQANM
jgi:4-diphosphocytidyl-2C-methyl-D-erythritol kinase